MQPLDRAQQKIRHRRTHRRCSSCWLSTALIASASIRISRMRPSICSMHHRRAHMLVRRVREAHSLLPHPLPSRLHIDSFNSTSPLSSSSWLARPLMPRFRCSKSHRPRIASMVAVNFSSVLRHPLFQPLLSGCTSLRRAPVGFSNRLPAWPPSESAVICIARSHPLCPILVTTSASSATRHMPPHHRRPRQRAHRRCFPSTFVHASQKRRL